MRIRTKLFLLVALFVAGLAGFGGAAFWVMGQVKVNGPYYKSIVQGKDIIADILPPPEYLVESYLNAFQISVERDRTKLEGLIAKSRALRSEYDIRHEYWIRDLAEGPLKEALVVESYRPGLEFLDAKDRIFIPAALSGDSVLMQKTLHGVLTPKYDQHLSAILEVVRMATDRTRQDEKSAEARIRLGNALMGGIGLGITLSVSGLCFVFIRQITRPLSRVASELGTASQGLRAVSEQMSANAEETSAQVDSVSDSSGRISASVETAASQTGKMSESIEDITRSTSESARVAESAVARAQSTQAIVNKLGASSSEIGGIVKVISSIAFQSNLLALNAAIEAARAGEAGKGFAVVADEVRNLAIETAKATEDIGRKIEAIRCDTGDAIKAIGDITVIIVQISGIQGEISAAVGKQTGTTREISRNISSAAQGTSEIAGNIDGVSKAAQSTAAGALDTQKAAGELVRMAEELSRFVT